MYISIYIYIYIYINIYSERSGGGPLRPPGRRGWPRLLRGAKLIMIYIYIYRCILYMYVCMCVYIYIHMLYIILRGVEPND